VLELAKGWWRGNNDFGSCRGKGSETGESSGGKVGLSRYRGGSGGDGLNLWVLAGILRKKGWEGVGNMGVRCKEGRVTCGRPCTVAKTAMGLG
jgi:hypothetical protein